MLIRNLRFLSHRITPALVLVLGGCSLVPHYDRPDPALPAAWSATLVATTVPCPAPCSTWWESFGSAELTALVTQSREGSFTQQAAAARVEQAKAIAQIAAAPLYPALELDATAARSHGFSSPRTQNIFAQASYEFDLWGKNSAAVGSADALARASVFDRETAALTLTAAVADTYFQALSLQERIRLAQEIAGNGPVHDFAAAA